MPTPLAPVSPFSLTTARLSHRPGRRRCRRGPPPPPVALGLLALLAWALSGCVAGRISDTGLYEDTPTQRVADGYEVFTPRFTLWTDGADKRRFIKLPDGEQIDTSDMDRWVFPVGTALYKEFRRDGVLVETREQRKLADGTWTMTAYAWDDEERDAVAAFWGEENARGTDHDVPATLACVACHSDDEPVLGFSAIQLDHEGEGLTLARLVERGLLSDPPAAPLTLPGDPLDQEVLGALHVNCGACHDDAGSMARAPLRLRLRTTDLDSVESTAAYRSAVGQTSRIDLDGRTDYVVPGAPDASLLLFRMSNRGGRAQMPPLATERRDTVTLQGVRAWIDRLGR